MWNISKCSIQFSGQGKPEWKKAAIFTTSGATEPQNVAVKIKKKYSAKWCRPFNANHATDENITDWLK